MPVGTNEIESESDCGDLKFYYVCSSGFRGCCSHEPCTPGYCEDDVKSSSNSKTSTSTTATSKPQSRTSAPTITTSAAPTTSSAGLITSSANPTTPTATSETVPVAENPSSSSINVILIGGIGGGILALILAGIFIFFCFCRRKRKEKKRSSGYDTVQDKTAELDTPNSTYHFMGHGGTRESPYTPSTLNYTYQSGSPSSSAPTTGGDPAILLAGKPLLPNELPASSPSCPLELPSSVYKPPLPELSQNPTRELINQQSTLQNSLIQPRRATNHPPLTTTPEGAILGSNLNSSLLSKDRRGAPDPRHHVMSFMSYSNRSDTRLGAT